MALATVAGLTALQGETQVPLTALERGALNDRLDALVRVFDIPPAQREPGLWRALMREARRMGANYRGPKAHIEAEDQGER